MKVLLIITFKNKLKFLNYMQEYKDKVEAILFTTGSFMSVEEVSKSCGIASQGTVKELIEELAIVWNPIIRRKIECEFLFPY